MKTQAISRNLRISPRKLRLVADTVRDMSAVEAKYLLLNNNKKAARIVFDALNSAMANAQNNHGSKKDQLAITEVKVDEGKKLKRFRPRARGMSASVIHRFSHLTIIVSDDQLKKTLVKTTPKKSAKPSLKEKK